MAECKSHNPSHRPENIEKNLATRLNRIEGQVKGIKSMIDRKVYCDDILTQIAAVQSAMSSVAKILLKSHIHSCIAPRLQSGDDSVIDEFIKTVGRL